MLLNNTPLSKKLKGIVSKQEAVADVLIFGSAVRGKENPKDVDVLIIFKTKVDKEIEHRIQKQLISKEQKVSISAKTLSGVLEPSFDARESVLFEGISLISGKNLAQEYGFVSFGMFKYHFEEWSKLQRTKFYYALNGRGGKEGFFQRTRGIKLSDQIILVPLEQIEKFKAFLDAWKVEYHCIPILIPARLSQQKILEGR